MSKSINKELKISALLKGKYIELNLKEKEKLGVIAELVNLVCRSGKIRDRKALFEAIVEREKLGSTAIGNGVAIPHVKIKGIKKPILVFGRSAEGVDFNSLDGEKTYIFFMLISPQEDVGTHLKILARVARLMKDKFTVKHLKDVKNKYEIFPIISDIERYLNL